MFHQLILTAGAQEFAIQGGHNLADADGAQHRLVGQRRQNLNPLFGQVRLDLLFDKVKATLRHAVDDDAHQSLTHPHRSHQGVIDQLQVIMITDNRDDLGVQQFHCLRG